MVAVGWLGQVDLPRPGLRARTPRVEAADQAAGGDPARAAARIPSVAIQVMREASQQGPVLVSVARAGYLPGLACQTCREPVDLSAVRRGRCRPTGPGGVSVCQTHGRLPAVALPALRRDPLRAAAVGVRRTAEEFGRALPGVRGRDVLGRERDRPRPDPVRRCRRGHAGAEPDPGPEPVRRPRPARRRRRPCPDPGCGWPRRCCGGGSLPPAWSARRTQAVASWSSGDAELREVQALIRWDPRGYARARARRAARPRPAAGGAHRPAGRAGARGRGGGRRGGGCAGPSAPAPLGSAARRGRSGTVSCRRRPRSTAPAA